MRLLRPSLAFIGLSAALLTLTACDSEPPLIGADSGPMLDAGRVDSGPVLACDNGVRDGDETATDCGGSCPGCPAGATCSTGDDCNDGVCSRGFCLMPTCSDGVRNGDETGTDCGGSCDLCPGGEPCTSNEQCLSGRCGSGGVCAPSGCDDGRKNGDETDVDCGGPTCPACEAGSECIDPDDCDSLICVSGTCEAATCSDRVQNQDETSVDCGGTRCAPCRDGLSCGIDADCENGRCFEGGCISCMDGIRNAEETGVDCGGSRCDACEPGEMCFVDSDCAEGSCRSGVCESCTDGVQNQDESDVDCGGTVCAGCPAGGACTADIDCFNGSCSTTTNTCVNCIDNILNQDESDVDCGGTVCLPCGPGFSCMSGADCASGVCDAGACVGLSPNPTFQITNLTNLACATVDHNTITGDDRGGIGITDQVVMYTGDTATGRYALDLTGGTALFPATSLVGTGRDAMVSNARDGTIYLLADAAGPKTAYAGGSITRLIPMNADGSAATAGIITLSTPISVRTSDVGLFSGWDRIVIHDGTAVQSIAIPSGTVTNLGTMTMPSHRRCENWAYWGIAETDGANTNLVYAGDFNDRIERVAVPSGTVTTVAAFTDLSDMCSFSPSLSNNRWYFHHESSSQFISPASEVVGYCPATYDTTGGNFRVSAMSATGCMAIDHASLIGDDRGGVAVSPTNVYVSGDSGLGRWALDLTGGESSGSTGIQHDAIVSDIRSGTSYLLANASGPIVRYSGGTITRLIALDPTTGLETATSITLSTPITVPGSGVGLFSGWNRIIIHDGTSAQLIELPSGTVTNLGAMPTPPHQTCESWAYWGIAEFFGGTNYVIAATTTDDLVRYEVPTGTVAYTWPFTNLGDMCSITFSPHTNRWYFHHEGTSELTTGPSAETLGYCRGVYGNP